MSFSRFSAWTAWAEKPQLGSFGDPFMYNRIGFSAIWRWIFSKVELIVVLP